MAAAMDVDTPSGTNSGASKKRFEVKKVWVHEVIRFRRVNYLHNLSTAPNVR